MVRCESPSQLSQGTHIDLNPRLTCPFLDGTHSHLPPAPVIPWNSPLPQPTSRPSTAFGRGELPLACENSARFWSALLLAALSVSRVRNQQSKAARRRSTPKRWRAFILATRRQHRNGPELLE